MRHASLLWWGAMFAWRGRLTRVSLHSFDRCLVEYRPGRRKGAAGARASWRVCAVRANRCVCGLCVQVMHAFEPRGVVAGWFLSTILYLKKHSCCESVFSCTARGVYGRSRHHSPTHLRGHPAQPLAAGLAGSPLRSFLPLLSFFVAHGLTYVYVGLKGSGQVCLLCKTVPPGARLSISEPILVSVHASFLNINSYINQIISL